MDNPTILLDHLAQAERHISFGEQTVRRQRSIVAGLESGRRDSTDARKLLKSFEDHLSSHVADRKRLIRELGRP